MSEQEKPLPLDEAVKKMSPMAQAAYGFFQRGECPKCGSSRTTCCSSCESTGQLRLKCMSCGYHERGSP